MSFGLGVGPLGALRHTAAPHLTPPSSVASSTTSAKAGSDTSTTDRSLAERSYDTGACVTWDQASTQNGLHTQVVPCAQPHLIEVVGSATVADSTTYSADGPTEQQYDALETQLCLPKVVAFLGTSLDPAGRFYAGGISPTPDAWRSGYRTLWCGISANPPNGVILPGGQLQSFTGEAKGASQSHLYDAGICVVEASGATPQATVACTSPHNYEITGTATMPAQVTTFPASTDAQRAAVGAACDQVAQTYHGSPVALPLTADWIPMLQSSWNAGQRSVNCAITFFNSSGTLLALSGSARAGGVPH